MQYLSLFSPCPHMTFNINPHFSQIHIVTLAETRVRSSPNGAASSISPYLAPAPALFLFVINALVSLFLSAQLWFFDKFDI